MRRWVTTTFLGAAAGLLLAIATSPVGGSRVIADVVPAVCGNGVVEAPETCDDGNLAAGDGCSSVCQVENRPPDCRNALPSVAEIWPPNHKFVRVTVGGVTDPDGDPVFVAVMGVSQDEALDGAGDGSTCPDAMGLGSDTTSVRAERSGRGDGRVYHVRFAADDGRGGACVGEVTVCVPHDHRPGGTCTDQGALFDSMGSAAVACDGATCDPQDCVPSADDLAPTECTNEPFPAAVERRTSRARELLERAGRRHGHGARRLRLKAAKVARKAAASAVRAARHDDLSAECADALHDRLEDAGTCAACLAE